MRRTRHIEIKHLKVLEWVKARVIALVYVPSADNLADIFTKASRKPVYLSNRDMILSRVGLATTASTEAGLVSYDAGEFAELAGAKPAVSSISENRQTSLSDVMTHLYQHMTHEKND